MNKVVLPIFVCSISNGRVASNQNIGAVKNSMTVDDIEEADDG